MALPVVREDPLAEAVGGFTPEKLAAIQQLNVDPANARFMLLVDDLLRPESLPRGWSAEFNAAENRWVYKDKAGQLHDKHPVYDYYIGAMFMDLGGYAQLKANVAARPPTAEEVQQMGQYFGIKQDEDKYIWEVAEMGLCAPLPPDWVEEVVQRPGDPAPGIAFRQEKTGKVQQDHPMDNYFRELIRRRRRELLRRKKAALRSLQALIKMGMGRRSMLAAAAAAAGAGQQQHLEQQQEPDTDWDVDDFDSNTQTALQHAWEGLLGTASQLVHCMQAAAWDGSTSIPITIKLGPDSASPSHTDPTDSVLPGNSTSASSGLGSEAAAASSHSLTAETQQQLQHLSDVLSEAVGHSCDPVKAATNALSDIQRLAAQVAAAGTNTAALAAVLSGRGLQLPPFCFSSVLSDADAEVADQGYCGPDVITPEGSSSDGTAASQGGVRHSGRHSSILDTSGGLVCQGSGSSCGSRRPSRSSFTGDAPQQPVQRRQSLLRDALPFVGADGGTTSTAGAVSTAGTGEAPWSLSGLQPDAAGQAAAANARSAAAAARAAAVPASSPAGEGTGGSRSPGGEREGIDEQFARAFDAAAGGAQTGAASSSDSAGPAGLASAQGSPSSTVPAELPSTACTTGAVLSLVHGSEFPPAAEAALQHLSALQAVLQQALRLITSWQQQKVIIALLLQQVQHAVAAANSRQRRLADTTREVRQLRAEQEHQLAAAAALAQSCGQITEQLQQAQRDAAAALEAQQGLEQQLENARKELAAKEALFQKLQADTSSDSKAAAMAAAAAAAQADAAAAAAAAAQAASQEAAQQQLQELTQKLQAELTTAQAAASEALERAQELEQQLAAATQQLQQEQAEKQAALQQLQQCGDELAALQANHQQLLSNNGSEAATAAAELQKAQSVLHQLQDSHRALQAEHASALSAVDAACKQQQALEQQLAEAQQQLADALAAHAALQAQYARQAQRLSEAEAALRAMNDNHGKQGTELTAIQQQLTALQDTHAATLVQQRQLQQEQQQLQELHAATLAQQQQLQQEQQLLQELHAATLAQQQQLQQQQQQLQELHAATLVQQQQLQQQHTALQDTYAATLAQQQQLHEQLTALQGTHAAALKQQQELQQEKQQLLVQQDALQLALSNAQTELTDMQAAAKAAEEKRAAMPHKSNQVSATDHAMLHWVHSRGVQTGEELDPRSKKGAATPADLSLLSYFFREIKQKQRGGGGAILGYDPQEAANAAAGPAPSAKSWSGGTGLPPIAASSGGKGPPKSPAMAKRPATMPGNLGAGKRQTEEEEETGGFDLRPPAWEVRQRVDRRRDRAIKLETGKTAPDDDKWDYAQDERDNEIAELKRRLVEAEHKAKEAAGKAADELKELAAELQACKRSLQQVQAENFTLNKDVVTLKLAMQAVELADGSSAVVAAAGVSDGGMAGPRMSVFPAGGNLRGLKAARASMAIDAAGEAGVGLSAAVLGGRGSVALLSGGGAGAGQGAGMGGILHAAAAGGGGGGRASMMQYGTGRLSALPTGLGAPSPSPAHVSAGQAISPYAAMARKSVSAPNGN